MIDTLLLRLCLCPCLLPIVYWQVFKVWNAVQSRMEALSVMNRELVAESGSEEVVSDERAAPLLLRLTPAFNSSSVWTPTPPTSAFLT